MKLQVIIAGYATKPENRCFEDFAGALTCALQDLGQLGGGGRSIMLGANASTVTIPEDAIIYNAEQIAVAENPLSLIATNDRKRIIWDYSAANVKRWRELGFERVVHCPVGYHRTMERIQPAEEDVDLLFYGAPSLRRAMTLRVLKKAGLRVLHLNDVYGEELDRAIAKAKVVLNLHHSPGPAVFEIFRCSHLLANKKCVVSERGADVDSDLALLARESCAMPLEQEFAEICRVLVRWQDHRQEIAQRGYEAFKTIDLIEVVRQAVEQTARF